MDAWNLIEKDAPNRYEKNYKKTWA